MVFDSYCIPMGMPAEEKRKHSREEIRGLLTKSEEAFGLQPGTLSKKGVTAKIKEETGLSVVDIRKAVIHCLISKTLTEKKEVAAALGIKRDHLFWNVRQANNHLYAKDPQFTKYYAIVSSIAI